jgi:hypothetical protein
LQRDCNGRRLGAATLAHLDTHRNCHDWFVRWHCEPPRGGHARCRAAQLTITAVLGGEDRLANGFAGRDADRSTGSHVRRRTGERARRRTLELEDRVQSCLVTSLMYLSRHHAADWATTGIHAFVVRGRWRWRRKGGSRRYAWLPTPLR